MKMKKGQGSTAAKEILDSGKALKKMEQIIMIQGKQKPFKLGNHKYEVKCNHIGRVQEIDNDIIAKIARIAGAPFDKGAGLYLSKKVHEPVKKGEWLYTVYAESKFKLELAKEFLRSNNGYSIG